MKKSIASLLFTFAFSMGIQAQDYKVPVTNENEKMAEGQYQPQWESLKKHKPSPTNDIAPVLKIAK